MGGVYRTRSLGWHGHLGTGGTRADCYICLLQQSSVKNVFIRGSVVRYVHLPANAVDTPLLEDATRRGTKLLLFPDVMRTCDEGIYLTNNYNCRGFTNRFEGQAGRCAVILEHTDNTTIW